MTKKHSWGSDPEAMVDYIPPSSPPPDNTGNHSYNCGFLYSRVRDPALGLQNKTIEFIVYNSERDTFYTKPKLIDSLASQIAILNARSSHSATYKFTLSITKESFINTLLMSKNTHAFFHGVFDGISCVKTNDVPGRVTLQVSPELYDYINERLEADNREFRVLHGHNDITDRKIIEEIQNIVYFPDNPQQTYNYNTTKEIQITDYITNRAQRKKFTKRQDHQPSRSNTRYPEQQCYNSIIPMSDNFVMPVYATSQSIGADVSVTHFVKETNGVQYYGTGFGITPAFGCYVTLFPRSSLSKKGFLLGNSVGLIDPDYQGELLVALVRHDGTNERITEFPMAVAQLVTNPIFKPEYTQVANFAETTQRGTGGFGSTDTIAMPAPVTPQRSNRY